MAITSPPSLTPSGADSRVNFDASSCLCTKSSNARSKGAAIAFRLSKDARRIRSSFASEQMSVASSFPVNGWTNPGLQAGSRDRSELRNYSLIRARQYRIHIPARELLVRHTAQALCNT